MRNEASYESEMFSKPSGCVELALKEPTDLV